MSGPWDRYANQQPQGQVFADPAAPTRTLREEAELDRTIAQTDKDRRDIEAAERERELEERRRSRGRLADGMKYGNVLDAVRNARRLAMQGGTGLESYLSVLPETTARALDTELEPIRSNLAFDRLQQMRDASETGGALGSITERELAMLQATVASLDTGVDLPTFLDRLDRIERHFMGAQMAMAGIDPASPEGRQAYRDFDYTGVLDGENRQDGGQLADPNASEERIAIPQEYQDAHLRYLRDNWGNINPAEYTRFRAAMDEQFGFTPNLQAYGDAASQFNKVAAEGGRPESLGGVPPVTREMGMIEQVINAGAQSAPGAFAANLANAATLGAPSVLSGNQQGLELLREQRPYSSFGGELVGSILASKGVGAAGGIARINPLAADVVANAVYGATQDTQNPLRGALFGGAGAAGGSLLGRQIGEAMPNTYAPGAMRDAAEQVPSVADLKNLSNQQYQAVEATGVTAGADQTQRLVEQFDALLTREGRITPQGREIDVDTPVTRARMLVQDFAGQEMTPRQAQRVRGVLGEGAMSSDPAQRRLSNMLLDQFDTWADPVLPGIDVPRATASRYLQGQQIAGAMERANPRASQFSGSGMENAMRTEFRALDRDMIEGTARFAPEVGEAIRRTSRGTPIANALRNVGKLAPTGVVSFGLGGGTVGALGNAVGGPALGVLAAGATMGTGALARKAAEKSVLNSAETARLLALGGPEYQAALAQAVQAARRNAGNVYGGLFGVSAGTATREPSWTASR